MIYNVLEEYNRVLPCYIPKDKINLRPLLKTISEKINLERDKFKYKKIMLLSTGKIDDIEDTIDIVVKYSDLPVSIIVIGMGNSYFKLLKK